MRGNKYLDTSFLFKSYITEAHSAEVTEFLETLPERAIVSALTDVEMAAAFARKLPLLAARTAFALYSRDRRLKLYRDVEITPEVYSVAGRLTLQYGHSTRLRSLDALHLATALEYGVDTMATYDGRLATAAAELGLSVIGARP